MVIKVVVKGGGSAKEVLARYQKRFGAAVGNFGGAPSNGERIPTGLFPLDLAIGGGIPRGRCTILYGPADSGKTSVAYLTIRSHQMMWPELTCVYVAIEPFDALWAGKLGVDITKLIVLSPNFAEEAVDMTAEMLSADDVGLVVVDSLAAMITTQESEKSAEGSNMGGQGLVTGKMVRKTALALREAEKNGNNPTLLYINQIRHKMGVMYGDPECLHQDVNIPMADGRSFTVREIYDQNIEGNVWGYDPDTGEVAPQPIISRHFNGNANPGDFITVTSQAVETANGVMSATVSRTHNFLTSKGWLPASKLTTGDSLVTKYTDFVTPVIRDFLAGLVVGDCTMTNPNGGLVYGLRFQDKSDPAYLSWKVGLLEPHMHVSVSNGIALTAGYHTLYKLFGASPKRHPCNLFANFSYMGLAVWIMDDAYFGRDRYTLAIGRARHDSELREYVKTQFAGLGYVGNWSKSGRNFVFGTNSSMRLAKEIAAFVPPCMHRKLPKGFGGDGLTSLGAAEVHLRPTHVGITAVKPASARKYRSNGLYDLHVGGANTYLAGNVANGFVVHNTMPGGNAPVFQAQLRVRLYGKAIKDSKISDAFPVRREVSFIVKKSKVAIVADTGKFEMVTYPYDGLVPGDTDDINTITTFLKTFDQMEKTKTGWNIMGEGYPTIQAFKDRVYSDRVFGASVRSTIIATVLAKKEGTAPTPISVDADGVVTEDEAPDEDPS